MTAISGVIGNRPARAHREPGARPRAVVFGAMAVLAAGCSGDLGHRSVEEFAGSIPIPAGVDLVRIEIPNGTVGLDVHVDQTVSYAGGVRRAANTAEALGQLEQVKMAFVAGPDPTVPTTLVIRGPEPPVGVAGMLALELGFRLPPGLAVEIVVEHNGHITAARRLAPLTASTGRGDLRFEACGGAIQARTGRGNVIAFDHRGDLEIVTAVGDMQVFVREPGSTIRLDTGDGTVQCYVPPTTGFRLDARAQIGKCGSSFGFAVENPTKFSAVMTGARGDERTKILLRTGKGHLSLGSKTFP